MASTDPLTDPRAPWRSGTVVDGDPTILISAPDSARALTAAPARLADLMLAAPLVHRASLAVLEPGGDLSAVSIQRGSSTVAELHVLPGQAAAVVARLSVIAGVDPLAEAPSLHGSHNTGRAMIRVGRDVAEVLVTVSASPQGFRAEVHPLSINGGPPDLRAAGLLRRCTTCHAYQAGGLPACEIDGGALVEVEDSPVPGGTIGAYRILACLGEGTGGMVFAAEHALLGRPAAIKVLQRSLTSNVLLKRRFLSEARAASRLRHRNIVDVADFGLLQDGRPYMVMERLAGISLETLLQRSGAFPPDLALRTAREIALALGAAHAAGLAHNDLKPANVIVLHGSTDEVPRIKLIDFGAASALDTADDLLFGTPGYMAPERLLGEPSDARADLYSLGVVLHEMLAGAAPFQGNELGQLLLAQVRRAPPSAVSPFGALPPAVTRLLGRALAVKAPWRQQSAAEMVSEIDQALAALASEGRWLS